MVHFVWGVGEIAKVMDAYVGANGFICTQEYAPQGLKYLERPVYVFEDVTSKDLPIYIPVAYRNQNRDRQKIFEMVEAKGWEILSFVHPTAHVHQSVELGKGAWINPLTNIDPYVKAGKGLTTWNLAHIGHSSELGDFCWVTTGAVICGQVKLGNNVFVGANAVIFPQVNIGNYCTIAAGAIVSKDMPDHYIALDGKDNFIPKREVHQYE